MANLKINGLDKLVQKLGALDAANYLRGVISAATLRIKSAASVYPPSTDANTPKSYPGRWYERGFGARWALKSGGTGGKRTSERLGTQWYARSNALMGVVGNRASYAQYPKGLTSRSPRQSMVMRRIGWTSLESDAERELPQIEHDMQRAVDRVMNG